jgi:MFS transporter, ACS family, D-galactonate transporter
MSVTADELVADRPGGGMSSLWRRQLDSYPNTVPRVAYLAITVLATIMLYYELYVGGSVSTLILVNLHMSFTFFVVTLAFGNLLGAFGSLFAGLTDRLGRANLVVFGLLFTGIFVAFVLPAATNKWVFTIEGFVVGVVEGICLVATPALIRDFSPQVGRATAMGFWTSGPVLGSLIVFVVASWTVPTSVTAQTNPAYWTHEYVICGIAGLVVFLVALVGLRELSPGLRDQLMVTMHDRTLIEAKAKGLTEADIEAALRHPFRQLLKPDVIISAIAVSIMLLIYYTAVGFAVIYLTTVFGMSVHSADALGNWNWGFNAIAVIAIGMISDRFRVRKPFMVVGGVAAAAMVVVYLVQAGHHPSYYSLALILAGLAFALGVAYTPWMASYTETVEARNPALTATGLAIWGWIIRIVVFASFLLIPVVINSVTPLVNYGTQVQAYATQYKSEIAFAAQHADIVAIAQKDKTQIANAQKFAPELAVIQANAALFTKLAAYTDPSKIPPKLAAQAVAAAGGGTKGLTILNTIAANKAAITGVIAVGAELQKLTPYVAQLKALQSFASSPAYPYLQAHGTAVQNAAAKTAGQWKNWYWICFGGIVFFLLSIPLLRGRWSPAAARKDEEEHEALVDAELAAMQV